jgi:hypothetical protein
MGVFLKMDMDERSAKEMVASRRSLKRRVMDLCIPLAPIDFYTVETRRGLETVRGYFEARSLPIHVVPSGFTPEDHANHAWVAPAKENLLLMGRLELHIRTPSSFLPWRGLRRRRAGRVLLVGRGSVPI